MKKRILITGSGGMLGIDLSHELRENYDVIGLDIAPDPRSSVMEFIKCDITDKDAVIEAVAGASPCAVIHAAAWTDVDGCELDEKKAYKINSEGTRHIALACRENDVLPIYISTDFVFDGKKKAPYTETDKAKPISIYGDSKLKGERFIKKNLRKYFVIRTSWLYGAEGKNFVDLILTKAKSADEMKVVDDQVGSPTYTKDLAKALHALLGKIFAKREARSTRYGIYHVSGSGRTSWYEYAKEILTLAHSESRVIPISSGELSRPAKRPAMSVLDNSKFLKFTGYKMRDWEYSLKSYLSSKKQR